MARYNPYSSRYTDPLEGVGYVYQPVYDSSEADRWANLLAQRQQRYDLGQQQIAQAQSQFGGMETYAPELLGQRVGDFTSRMEQMVKDQYGGDYGLASNTLLKEIAKERSDPFYKYVAEQNKLYDLAQKTKASNPDTYFEYFGQEDLTPEQRLNRAIKSRSMEGLAPQYGITPDTYALAERQLKNVTPNVYESLIKDFSPEELQKLSESGITDTSGLLKSGMWKGISKERLNDLANSMAESMMNQTSYFTNKYGIDEVEAFNPTTGKNEKMPAAKAEALNVIKNAIPQFVFGQNQTDFKDLSKLINSSDQNSDGLYSWTYGEPLVDEGKQKDIQKLIKDITASNQDLNLPTIRPTNEQKLRSELYNSFVNASVRTGKISDNLLANKEFTNSVNKVKDMLPTYQKIFKSIGIDMPEWINEYARLDTTKPIIARAGLNILKAVHNAPTKVPGTVAGGISNMYNSFAKIASGIGDVKDAYNIIDEYEKLNGPIDSDDFNTKFTLASQALLNGTAVSSTYLNIPSGDSKYFGSNRPYNRKELNSMLDAGQFNNGIEMMEDGKWVSVDREKVINKLDLPKDVKIKDFNVSQYNPRTGKFIATYEYEGETKKIQLTNGKFEQDTRQIRDLDKQFKNKGFAVYRMNNGLTAIGYNSLQYDPDLDSYKSVPVIKQVNSNMIPDNADLNLVKNIINSDPRDVYSFNNYSFELFKSLNKSYGE